MHNVTSLHGPRPVAAALSSAAYRTQPGWLLTFAGVVRASVLAPSRGSADARPEAARKAA